MKTLEDFYLVWEAFLRVKTKEKAEKVLNRIGKNLDRELRIDVCEQYWKDKALFRTNFYCVLQSKNIASAVMETLQLNGKIAERWNITRPNEYDNEAWQFSGTALESTFPGVEMITFHLQNFEV